MLFDDRENIHKADIISKMLIVFISASDNTYKICSNLYRQLLSQTCGLDVKCLIDACLQSKRSDLFEFILLEGHDTFEDTTLI